MRRDGNRSLLITITAVALTITLIFLLSSVTSQASPKYEQGFIQITLVDTQVIARQEFVEFQRTERLSYDPEPEPEYRIYSLGNFILTAYCACVICTEEWSAAHPSRVGTSFVQLTASGTKPIEGRTIAVDTGVIPFGSIIIIDGDEFVAEDRGGAIVGNRIDIFFESHYEALEFGVQETEVFLRQFYGFA